MKILFFTRKRPTDVGGLARFVHILTSYFQTSRVVCAKQPHTWARVAQAGRLDAICATDTTLLPFGALFKWLCGIQLVVIVYGKDLTFPVWWYQLAIRLFLRFADQVVAISPQTASLITAYPVDAKKLRVIIPGISVHQFTKKRPIATVWPKGARVLLTLGNLVARKGHAWFIASVLPKLPHTWVYVIVGEGPEEHHVRVTAKQAGVDKRVFLFPRQSDAVVSFLLSQADLYVSPNQIIADDIEGFGIAAGEAAALGIPVIASNVDGIPTMIHHEKNGILLPPDAGIWVKTIKHLGSQAARRLGRRGRHYTQKHFSWAATVAQYRKLFTEMIGKTR